jgi:hypothetical protein
MARQIHDRIRRRKRKKRRDHRSAVNLRFDFLDAMAEVGAQRRRLGERPQAARFDRRAIRRDACERNPELPRIGTGLREKWPFGSGSDVRVAGAGAARRVEQRR